MSDDYQSKTLLELTAQIVSAHVAKNQIPAQGLTGLIEQVYAALKTVGGDQAVAVAERPTPVVPWRRSVFPDYIICLEDGRKLKTLKRHLRSEFGLSPEQYREKWGLPPEYPMVAPNYAEHRSNLAKQLGLGRKPVGAAAAEPPVAAVVAQPAPHAPAPTRGEAPTRRAAEPTADAVFARFPAKVAAEPAIAEPDAAKKKRGRKPLSKQLARGMRP